MDTVRKILIDKCKLVSEYYLFSLHTFGATYLLTKKLKKQFLQILNSICKLDENFIYVNPQESIVIDYEKFDLDLEHILRKKVADMSGIEMNVLLHHLTGATIILCPFYDCWTTTNRAIFLKDHGNEYLKARRILLINDILF